MTHESAKNDDFNLSTSQSTTVIELADVIFNKINPGKKLKIKNLEPFTYDVQKRIPSTVKAKELLGFEATTSLSDMLDIVIPWVKEAKENNLY